MADTELSNRERELLGMPVTAADHTTSTTTDAVTTPAATEMSDRERQLLGLAATPAEAEQASAGQSSGLLSDIGTGLKESFMPFQVTKEEANKESGLARPLANIAGDIGQMVTAARVGATVGGVPGAIVGAGLGAGLAVYRALGFEKMRSEAEDRPINAKNLAVNLAVEGLPLLKYTKKATNIALSAAQAGAQYTQAKQYGASDGMAALLGAVGGVVSGATRAHVTPAEREASGLVAFISDPSMTKKSLEGLGEIVSEGDNSMQITKQAYKHLEQHKVGEDALAKAVTQDLQGEDYGKWVGKAGHLIEDIRTLPETRRLESKLVAGKGPYASLFKELEKQKIVDDPGKFAAFLVAKDYRDGMVNMITARAGKRAGAEASEILAKEATTPELAFQSYRLRRLLTDIVKEKAPAGLELKDPLKSPLWALGSDYHAARAMDFVLGTDFRSKFERLATSELAHKTAVQQLNTQIGRLEREAKKLKVDPTDISKMLEMKSIPRQEFMKAKYGDRVPSVTKLLVGWREQFNDIRAFGQASNIEIPYRQRYVTSMRQDITDMVGSLDKSIRNAEQVATERGIAADTPLREFFNSLDERQSQQLSRSALGQLWQSAQQVMDRKIKTFGELQDAVRQLQNPDVLKKHLGFEASGAFAREGNIPDLIRERNIGQVARAYARNMSRAVHLDQPIKDISEMRAVLNTAGFKKSVDWLDDYVRKQSGDPGSVTSWLSAQAAKSRIGLSRALEDPDRSGFTKTIPKAKLLALDLLSLASNQVYPNYLGGRLGPVFRNLLQPALLTGPEVGGLAGQNIIRKAAMRTALDRAKGQNLEEATLKYIQAAKTHPEVRRWWTNVNVAPGTVSPFEEGFYLQPVIKGLKAGGLREKSERFLDYAGRASLYIYGKTDAINRYMTIQAGKQITEDLLNNAGYARKFISKADPAIKADITRLSMIARREHDPAKVEQIRQTLEYTINAYLIGKTQFYYSKANSFRLGRELGPLFSMFTKFPTMVGSDIAEGFSQHKGWSNLVQKYIAPLAAMTAVYKILGDTKDEPRARTFLLKDAWQLSPLAAPLGVRPPPILSAAAAAGEGLLGAFTGDIEQAPGKLASGVKKLGESYIPFQWIPKMQKDLVRTFENREPEE